MLVIKLEPVYILLYVDDFIIANKDLQEMTVIKNKLKGKFKIRDLRNFKLRRGGGLSNFSYSWP
jgi:hypothetical protein